MLRRVLLRPARCALLSTAVNAESPSFEYLALDNGRLLPHPAVTRRVLEYLCVNPKDLQRALSDDDESRPQSLPYKALFAPNTVHLLTPLVRWGFQQLNTQSELQEAADAVFSALQPHTNMARGVVWRQYFQRQFFLSEAPLSAYLHALRNHHDALPLKSRAKVEELDEEDEEVEGDEEDGDDEPAAVLKEQGRRQGSLNRNSSAIILAENKEWEWVPLHLALGIVLEFCFRGRFAEATKAYTSLPLTDVMRRKVVQVLEEFEQYPSVLYLYEVHRSLGGAVQPLDVASELNALKKMGRVDEMDIRFQDLPTKEQSRADIQQLMGN